MSYDENQKALDSILSEAEGRGDDELYNHLKQKLEKLSDNWVTADDGRDLTPNEVTRLIERKHSILNRIDELRESDS
ncbi:MAG: hypothetical protein N0C84_03195 [Candidatus Thiodiazotropha taylori]|nr:hypothetical protein [Candidatus Thiodiazotropha taylori]MCW4255454.1 hypothetical protein [Candidatus Thiodiazotropha taylori]